MTSSIWFTESYYTDSHEVDRSCGCFIPCEGTEYRVKISAAMFPSDKVAEDIIHHENVTLTTEFLRWVTAQTGLQFLR